MLNGKIIGSLIRSLSIMMLCFSVSSCKGLLDVDGFGDPDAGIAEVSGSTLTFTASSFDFGSISIGALPISKSITVSNLSSFETSIEEFVVNGDSEFTLTNTNCPEAPETLAAKTSCQLSLSFAAGSVGSFSISIYASYAKGVSQSFPFQADTTFLAAGVSAVSPSPVQSEISVSASSVVSGDTITVTLESKDRDGNLMGIGGAEVKFSKLSASGNGTGSWIPNQNTVPAIDNNDGTYTAQFTGVTAGVLDITASIDGAIFSGARPTVTVQPGAAAGLTFSSNWSAGTPESYAGFELLPAPIVYIKDAAGNTTTSSAQVTLSADASSTGGTGTVGTTQINAINGVADFSGSGFGFSGAGTKVIKASIASPAISITSIAIDNKSPSLTIAANKELVIAYTSSEAPVTPNELMTLTPTTSSQKVTDTSSLLASVAGGSSVAHGGVAESTSGVGYNNLTDNTFEANITVTRNSSISSTCSTLGSFANIVCNFTAFTLDFFDLVDSPSSGGESVIINDEFVDSNGISVTKFVVTQVSDTYPSGTDASDIIGVYNNKLWYYSKSQSNKYKLFSVDTSGNVTQEYNIRGTGTDDVSVAVAPSMRVFNGKAYFPSYSTGKSLTKLVSMDSNGNVTLLSNTYANTSKHDYPQSMITHTNENAMYFVARDPLNKTKLYRMNADESIDQVTNLRASNNDDIAHMKYFNNELYFRGRSDNAKLKWMKINTTDGQVDQLVNFRNNNGVDDAIRAVTVVGDKIYMASKNSSGRYKAYAMNDDDTFTQIVANRPTNDDEGTDKFLSHGGKLYFVNDRSGANNFKLHEYDPSTSTVRQVSDFLGSSQSDNIARMTSWDGDLYIVASPSVGLNAYKLFRYDEANSIFQQVSNIVPSGSDDPTNFTSFNGALYFTAYQDGFGNTALFKLEKK